MSTIDTIKEQVLLEQLLPQAQLALSRGSKIPCPLPGHGGKDSTPSFHLYPNNSFHCFACRRGGSVIDLQMELAGQSFGEALHALAELAGIKIEPLTPEAEAQAAQAGLRAKALAFYVAHCVERLHPSKSGANTAAGSAALAYLASRGFDQEFLLEHQVGLDDGAWIKNFGIMQQAMEAQGLLQADFVHIQDEKGRWVPHPKNRTHLGLIRQGGGKATGFFTGRIVIPVFKGGKVVGLTARLMPRDGADKDGPPKYLHLQAPQGALFGEDRIRRDKPVYLTEGPMDALALLKVGAVGVAQFGTGGIERATRLESASALYLLLDADKAGKEATEKTGAKLLAKGMLPYLVQLPEGVKDPGEWLLQGLSLDALDAASAKAQSWPIAYATEYADTAPHVRNPFTQKLLEISREIKDGPAWREVQAALKALGLTVRAPGSATQEKKSAEGGAGEVRLDADMKDPIVPVFQVVPQLDGHLVRYTLWLPVIRAKKGDPSTKVSNIEPVMIEGAPDHKGGRTYVLRPLRDMRLTPQELDRVPSEVDIRGRWRHNGSRHSVAALVGGEVEPVSLTWLHAEVRRTFATYIWMRDERLLDLLACFVVVTYLYDLWDATPYLHLWGMRETAKSNVANILSFLCFNAAKSSSMSQSVLFRSVHALRGLQIVEEAESLSDPKPGSTAEELRILANDGYKRGAMAKRVEKRTDEAFAVASFDSYGPKVFASIEALESVLASRCIKVHMVRANASDIAAAGIRDMARDRDELRKRIPMLRDAIYCAAMQRVDSVADATTYLQDSPLLSHLLGRQREMWLPILSVAMTALLDEAEESAESEAGDDWDRLDPEAQEERVLACLAQLEADSGSLLNRLISLQRELERVAKADESEASIDVAALKAVYQITSTQDELVALAPDTWNKRHGWEIKALADHVSKELEEAGFLSRGGRAVMGGRRLCALLDKVGVTVKADRFEKKAYGRTERVRGVYIDQELLLSVLARHGVTIGQVTEAGQAQALAGVP